VFCVFRVRFGERFVGGWFWEKWGRVVGGRFGERFLGRFEGGSGRRAGGGCVKWVWGGGERGVEGGGSTVTWDLGVVEAWRSVERGRWGRVSGEKGSLGGMAEVLDHGVVYIW